MLETQELWAEYVQRQCELQAECVGSPMISYCPMLKWIECNKELDLLLSGLFVNELKNTPNIHPGFPGIVLSNPRKHGHIFLLSCS